MFNVWMQLPQFVNNKRPWSLIAQNITAEQAEVYRSTLLFPVHIEKAESAPETTTQEG
jgi:hypothetical protein